MSFPTIPTSLLVVHVPDSDHSNDPAWAAFEDHERESAVECLAERGVPAACHAPNLEWSLEHLLDFLAGEVMPGDVVNVGMVPLEQERAFHLVSVVDCVYKVKEARL